MSGLRVALRPDRTCETRRRLLAWAGAGLGAGPLGWAAGAQAQTPPEGLSAGQGPGLPAAELERAAHALHRLAYGPRPGDLERVAAMGVQRWIAEQLAPSALPMPPEIAAADARGANALSVVELYQTYGPTRANLERDGPNDPDAFGKVLQRAAVVVADAAHARLVRALRSPRQLEEVLVEFWFNHFNVFSGRPLVRPWVGAFEREAVRPHVFGRFRDLLGATARHPAMLAYLDNWRNVAPGLSFGQGQGRSTGLNENYARELMELHTLGADGGYTQADVVELARIFTGWTIAPGIFAGRAGAPGFVFDSRRHDGEGKTFLGAPVPQRGRLQGEWALDVLASHPSTARHLATRLARHFVADEPPARLVGAMSRRYLETDGDLREVMAVLVASDEFWAEGTRARQFKTPYQFVVSALRAADASEVDTRVVQAQLGLMGMPMYGCPTPDGYASTEAVWLNADALSRRIDFSAQLAAGRLRGVEAVDPHKVRAALGPRLGAGTRAAVDDLQGARLAMSLIGSPDFMRR